MGIIHSRASKKRAKAEAELAREQAKAIRGTRRSAKSADLAERVQEAADRQAWQQPTVGAMLGKAIGGAKAARERKASQE